MNKLKKYAEKLEKYNVNSVEFFIGILFSCINSKINIYEKFLNKYKDRDGFEELKKDLKIFYDYVYNYLHSLDLKKEIFLHTQLITIVDILLEINRKYIEKYIEVIISNITDLIFLKYDLNIDNFNSNEEIKEYLLKVIKDENIVNALILLLLSNTSLEFKYIDKVPDEDLEHVLRTILLISIYICKRDKDE